MIVLINVHYIFPCQGQFQFQLKMPAMSLAGKYVMYIDEKYHPKWLHLEIMYVWAAELNFQLKN